MNTPFLLPQERLLIYLDTFTSERTGHTRKIKNIIPTMISTAGGSWCCTRKTSMIATIENHCHRDRRSLSRRPEKRKKLPNVGFWLELSGARARMHATAKKPASRSSSNANLSITLFSRT
jgi:hypothetical protein